MAIAGMSKIMIVSHRSEAKRLLEALQEAGIVQVLSAEQSMVTKEWPELQIPGIRDKEREELLANIETAISFLSGYFQGDDFTSMLRPLVVVDEKMYEETASGKEALELLELVLKLENQIEQFRNKIEECQGKLNLLRPWASMNTPIEEFAGLSKTCSTAGILTGSHIEETIKKIEQLGGCIERINESKGFCACVIVCLKENYNEIYKCLRASDFDSMNFEGLNGTVQNNIKQIEAKLTDYENQLAVMEKSAGEFALRKVELQILFDHLANEITCKKVADSAPSTNHAVLYEGWVKKKDYQKVKKIVEQFEASCVSEVKPGEDEQVPVEIENKRLLKPFEVITRLYGMPQHFEVDPTAILAPFFAVFFALCLTDAGYGILIIAFAWYMLLKLQGDKKLMWLLLICSVLTVGAGAMVGGWFGDAPQQLAAAFGWTWLDNARQSMMWFDPLEEPMTFFIMAISLGYLHIMVGLVTAFINNLCKKEFIAALCDQLTWLVMLNSIVIYMFGSNLGVPASVGAVAGKIAMVPALGILLFSHREGSLVARLGMGLYNTFSTIFYMGDVLSYLRLMALGMVTGGLAMAINVMAKTAGEVPVIGKFVLIPLVLIGGHLFNTAISGLGAFVHTLRLQYVEFFPKFLVGGGALFEPLSKEYKQVYIAKNKSDKK